MICLSLPYTVTIRVWQMVANSSLRVLTRETDLEIYSVQLKRLNYCHGVFVMFLAQTVLYRIKTGHLILNTKLLLEQQEEDIK